MISIEMSCMHGKDCESTLNTLHLPKRKRNDAVKAADTANLCSSYLYSTFRGPNSAKRDSQ